MKNAKKLVALAAAATMLMSSATVYAAESISIEGDVNYVNTTIYKVTLPTSDGLSFLLDPQGLTSLDNGGTHSTDAAGKIVSEGTMEAVNESSVDVVLNADFYLVDSNTEDPVVIKASDADLTTDENSKQSEKEVKIYITTNDSTTDTVEVGSVAGAGTNFTMDAADYTYGVNEAGEYTYDLTENSGSTLTMEIEGTVAKDYDWSAYADGTQTLTLNAVFKFTKTAGGEEVENTEASTPVATDDYVMSLNEDGTVSYTFVDAPEGTITAFYVDSNEKMGAVNAGNVTYTDGVLKFNTTSVNGCGLNVAGSHTIVVTIADNEYPLTYTAE